MSITLFNAGRGAGKTYTLVQWAKEDPKRFVVGTTHTRDEMHAAGIKDQFVYLNDAKEDLRGRQVTEVAFDDFNSCIYEMLYRDFGLVPEVSVILATTFLEHEAKKKAQPVSGPYAEQMKKIFGGKADEALDYLDAAVGALDKLGLFSSVLLKEEPAKEEKPGTQTIKARFLWLGARLADGTGTVVGLSYENRTSRDILMADIKGSIFEGVLRLNVNAAVTVFAPSK